MRVPNAKRWTRLGLAMLTGLLIMTALLSVNIFPVITNDSLGYISHSFAIGESGWIRAGYRQVGYPLFLALARVVAGAFAIEPLLFAAVLQRILLIAALGVFVVIWRWAAVVAITFVFSIDAFSYTNFVLTEGLSLPLALLLAVTVHAFSKVVSSTEADSRYQWTWILGILIVLVSLVLLSLKFLYAVFGAAVLTMVCLSRASRFRRPAISLLAIYLVAAGVMAFAFSAENSDEYGVFAPSVDGNRSEYWSAWTLVFDVKSLPSDKPELRPFFDDGTPYTFMHATDSLPYEERQHANEMAIDELLDAAGISPTGSRIESFVWSLRGGRRHDVAGIVERIQMSTKDNVDRVIHSHGLARQDGGVESFIQAYNGGRSPEAIMPSGVGELPRPDARQLLSYLLPVSIVVLVLGLGTRSTRWVSLGALLIVVSYAAAIGYLRVDNYRHLLTTSSFTLVAATGVGIGLVAAFRRRGNARDD